LRLPRDHYVRLDANDYSVHPAGIGRRIDVSADLERVRAWCDGQLVADHQRCWARHQTITDPDHAQAAARLRAEHRATTHDEPGDEPGEVELRCLADYDRVLGLDSEGVA
jgi:hypothetical protein